MSSSTPAAPAPEPNSNQVSNSKASAGTGTRPVSRARRLLILSLRYAISPEEYAVVRRRVLLKGPSSVASQTPSKRQFEAVCGGAEDYVPASTRAGLRVFLASNLVLSLWDVVSTRLAKSRGKELSTVRTQLFKNPNFLCSLSLSALVVIHRLLYRFLSQLRSNLMLPNAQARRFRQRHPKISNVFTSTLSPSIGSSLAGLALLLHPASDQRVTIAVYTFVKALEYSYNKLEDDGWLPDRPWWFGSWLLFPISSGQLFYSFVFDKDCFPSEYGGFILSHSKEYVPQKPKDYPGWLKWPGPYEIVDSIGRLAGLNSPPFNSPILYPDSLLPASLSSISLVISPAHPTITSLQCALLHPHEPSCLKTYLHFWASEFTRVTKFMSVCYGIALVPRYREFLKNPVGALVKLSRSTLLTSTSITGSIGTAWAMCCLFQKVLPGKVLPKGRFWLSGMLGGLWAFVDSSGGRGNFLYSFRLGLVSAWKVLVKKGVVKGVKNGDVYLFILSLALINSLFDIDAHSVSGNVARRVLSSVRGFGMKDPVTELQKSHERKSIAEVETTEMKDKKNK
ncbi:hypothetical protein Q9L58_002367 [Maublancomyces gigas]|uniref:Uncharacterized protein n=1 Tax=Discina gigas TaxID=1032678 RepID=A0ABR3GRT8_9PEZI